ncbi:MAG: biotin--[Lachnospiraceae bacterium]|nr:biotin--[acetyl-CoA-carboxylase] ligase [Lachnospiraceae bacterium]
MSRDAEEIRRILNNDRLRVETFPEVASTNGLLLSRGAAGEAEGLILTADRQSAGRGRSGRSFFSPDGAGIYTSILLRPKLTMKQIEKLTPLAAVAVCEVLEEIAGFRLQIKWVNDVYRDGRKICGILAQTAPTFSAGIPDYVVMGIGIDLFPPQGGFPQEIRNVAGSLFREPEEVETYRSDPRIREKIIGRLWKRFYELYQDPDDASCVEAYRAHMMFLGEEIVAYDGAAEASERTAKLNGLTDDYALLLQFEGEDAPTTVRTGEIRIRRRL